VAKAYSGILIRRLSWQLSVSIASATARMVHSRRRQDRRKVFMRKQIGGTGTYPVYGVFRKVYVKLEKRTLGKFEIGLFFRENLSKDKVAKFI